MKISISNYTFNAVSRTITFNDFSSIMLEGILLITNVTRGTVIYQFNDLSKGGSVVANVLTLTFNTTTHSNTDKLNIIYEDFRPNSSLNLSSSPETTITRTLSSTYAVDDVWGSRFAITLPITGDGKTSIILSKINIKTSTMASLPSNFGSFTLFLFNNTTDSGNIADNDAFTRRLDAIDYNGYLLQQMVKATNDVGGRSTTYDINTPILIPNAVNMLYGYLVTNISYTHTNTTDSITIKFNFNL